MATLVWVPGSFAPPALYTPFLSTLRSAGIDVHIVTTPSVGPFSATRKPGTMSDDARAIEAVVLPLLDAGKDVVILCHSYGGIPTSQALEKLSGKQRRKEGGEGKKGVEKVIFLASVLLPVGLSNIKLFGGELPPFVTRHDEGYLTLDPQIAGPLTFSSLPETTAIENGKQMSSHSIASFEEHLTYAGYNDVECHWILCTEDKIVPPEGQRGFVSMLEGGGGGDGDGEAGKKREVRVWELKSDHCPSVSCPEELLEVIKGAMAA